MHILNLHSLIPGIDYFPERVSDIAPSQIKIQHIHFLKCKHIPNDVEDELQKTKSISPMMITQGRSIDEYKQYVDGSARDKGFFDTYPIRKSVYWSKDLMKSLPQADSFTCANCGKEGSDVTNTCNKCKSVKYCNAACKKKHRHKHKKACERYVAAARTDKTHRSKHEKARERFVTQGDDDDVLRAVLPIEQINDPFGQQCDTPGCQLAACCIWTHSGDPLTPWYCCLDCQEKDFKGWPADIKDIPLKVMSRALRNAMIERVRLAPCFIFDVCFVLLTN